MGRQNDTTGSLLETLSPDSSTITSGKEARISNIEATLEANKDLENRKKNLANESSKQLTEADLILMLNTQVLINKLIQDKQLAKYALHHPETALSIVFKNEILIDQFLQEVQSYWPFDKQPLPIHIRQEDLNNINQPMPSDGINYYLLNDKAKHNLVLTCIATKYPVTLGNLILTTPKLSEKLSTQSLIYLGRNHPNLAAQIMVQQELKRKLPSEETLPLSFFNRLAGAAIGFLTGLVLGATVYPFVNILDWIYPSSKSAAAIAGSTVKALITLGVIVASVLFPMIGIGVALMFCGFGVLHGFGGLIQGALGGVGAISNIVNTSFITKKGGNYGAVGQALKLSEPRLIPFYFSDQAGSLKNIADQAERFKTAPKAITAGKEQTQKPVNKPVETGEENASSYKGIFNSDTPPSPSSPNKEITASFEPPILNF